MFPTESGEGQEKYNQASSAYAQQQCTTKAQAVDQCATAVGNGYRSTLLERLERENRDTIARLDERERVISILRKHPEFEDFIAVLRSGLI